MSPILVRPVREQLEHDRIIRLLQIRLKRRYDIAVNIGDQQTASLRIGPGLMFPDLTLTSLDKGKRLEVIVEVETGESVNHLEAMAQWAHFGRARVPFHLYVPAVAVDQARRLCTENAVNVAEIWSYHSIGDQTRFTMVHRAAPRRPEPRTSASAAKRAPSAGKPAAPARKPASRPSRAAAPVRKAASRKGLSPARKASRPAKTSSGSQKRK